jgi:hypothetical protein
MKITEFAKPVTAKALNESLAQKFGVKVKLEDFTLEQLQDARNKLRTKLSQIETNESFDAVNTNETYHKNKLFLDVLNTAIAERELVSEGKFKKGDKVTVDGEETEITVPDGPGPLVGVKKDGKTDMVKADKVKKKTDESVLHEGEEEQAALIMATKDMVDRITGWMEDTAEMQTESMLELSDKIRDEIGSDVSENFVGTVKPALEALYASLETTRESLNGGLAIVTGQEVETMGDEMPAGDEEEMDMEPTVDGDEMDMEPEETDDFETSEPAVGGEEEAGRAKRESVERSRKLGTILSKKK